MPQIAIKHVLKMWEKKYGFIRLTDNEFTLFNLKANSVIDIIIDNVLITNIKIDIEKRLWVTCEGLTKFATGESISILKNEEENCLYFE